MPTVTEATIESETGYDYGYSATYDYGLLDSTLAAIAAAVSTTSANSLAVGDATTPSTATATTMADTRVTGAGTTSTANATTTSTTAALLGATTIATAFPQTTASTTTTSAGITTARAKSVTRSEAIATDAVSDILPVEYRVTRDGDTVEDAVYDVDPLVDTANPFGDYCVIKLDDRGGNKFEQYERGTRVDVAVSINGGLSFTNRFTGYVVERRENEQAGADALEVEVYSFDQFLRRNTVTNDQRGNTIADALADIIQTDTPVSYVAGNVDVGDDQELTRSYQGEAVENVLRDFAFKSNNEEFGVNDDLEFFFRPRETEHIDRGIDNTQWFRYDIPELGKEAINEVEVWFDDGDESVIVDDGTDKLDLQDNLGLPSPGTQRAELNRPLVTDIADAEDIGRKYLKFRNSTLSGTVTTFGLYDAKPGDTINITIDARGIDSEFVIAGVEYRWGVDETILTIIERRGDVDDILTDLNDSVQRVEMEGANRDSPSNRITTTNATAQLAAQVTLDEEIEASARFTNAGRGAVRDAFTGDGTFAFEVTNLVVGTDNSGLSRSNTALANRVDSYSVTTTPQGDTQVDFTASVSNTGVEELGLALGNGDLFLRATFDEPRDITQDVTLTVFVDNDANVSRGVVTTDGQTAIRDIIATNSPALPDQYAYGSNGASVSETETSLRNELVSVSLDDVLIQSVTSGGDFSTVTESLPATKPVVADDVLRPTEIAFTREGEAFDRGDTGSNNGPNDPSEFSDGDWAALSVDSHFVAFDFTLEHEVPGEQFELPVRVAGSTTTGGTAETVVRLEDTAGATIASDTLVPDGGTFDSPVWLTEVTTSDITKPLQPGEYSLVIECVTDKTALDDQTTFIDVVAPRDTRFNTTLDDTVNADGYLSGPERFPQRVEVPFQTANTQRVVDEASFTLTATDTSNDFVVALANDGTNFSIISNSDTGTALFPTEETNVNSRIELSRYSSSTTQTPVNGNDPQEVSTWELRANPIAITPNDISETVTRAVVPPNTIDGETVREAGLKSGSTLLTRHELAEFTVSPDSLLISAETTAFKQQSQTSRAPSALTAIGGSVSVNSGTGSLTLIERVIAFSGTDGTVTATGGTANLTLITPGVFLTGTDGTVTASGGTATLFFT